MLDILSTFNTEFSHKKRFQQKKTLACGTFFEVSTEMRCPCCHTYSKVSSNIQDDPDEEIDTHQQQKSQASNLLVFLLFLFFIILTPALVIYFSGILKSSKPIAVQEVGGNDSFWIIRIILNFNIIKVS